MSFKFARRALRKSRCVLAIRVHFGICAELLDVHECCDNGVMKNSSESVKLSNERKKSICVRGLSTFHKKVPDNIT